MLGLGPPELIVVMVIVMIVFGVGKLPQVGGALGKGIREFREASEGRPVPAGDPARAAPDAPQEG